MNKSVFLSDNIEENIRYDIDMNHTFISSKDEKIEEKKFEINDYENYKNDKISVKSATTRIWSIKIK